MDGKCLFHSLRFPQRIRGEPFGIIPHIDCLGWSYSYVKDISRLCSKCVSFLQQFTINVISFMLVLCARYVSLALLWVLITAQNTGMVNRITIFRHHSHTDADEASILLSKESVCL